MPCTEIDIPLRIGCRRPDKRLLGIENGFKTGRKNEAVFASEGEVTESPLSKLVIRTGLPKERGYGKKRNSDKKRQEPKSFFHSNHQGFIVSVSERWPWRTYFDGGS